LCTISKFPEMPYLLKSKFAIFLKLIDLMMILNISLIN